MALYKLGPRRTKLDSRKWVKVTSFPVRFFFDSSTDDCALAANPSPEIQVNEIEFIF